MNKLAALLTTALAATLLAAGPAHAESPEPPSVPDGIQVPEGNVVLFVGHAIGTQNYICLPSGAGYAWTLFTPEATLAKDSGNQLATHFFSPNPEENDVVRPTWLHSSDSSTVWAKLDAPASFDRDFVAPGAIPWLRLKASGSAEGTNGGDRMTLVTYIHRINTAGGLAPADGCAAAGDVGKSVFEPYSADYYFYAKR